MFSCNRRYRIEDVSLIKNCSPSGGSVQKQDYKGHWYESSLRRELFNGTLHDTENTKDEW